MSRRNYFCIALLLVTWSRPAFAQFSKCTQLIYAIEGADTPTITRYTSTQRDTCYGAYLRQLVPNPFVGLIREGALSTATVQRALPLVQFPEYSSANRRGYSGESRYTALQLRADQRLGDGGLLSANYTFSRSHGNAETITNWLDPVAGYQTNNLETQVNQPRLMQLAFRLTF